MTECTFAEIFGTTFRRLRKNAKLSQQEVATKGGFDRSYVTLIELGKKNPTMSVMEKMASIVSPSVREFFAELVKDIDVECKKKRDVGACSSTVTGKDSCPISGYKYDPQSTKDVPHEAAADI